MDNGLERQYIKSVDLAHRKEYAQFFTPVEIAQFMSRWLVQNDGIRSILEPAFGLGIFSRALLEERKNIHIDAYDIDRVILNAAHDTFGTSQNVNIIQQDYLQTDWNKKYDGVICNPPYLKFHDYDNATGIATIKQHLDYTLSGFTNLYALFLLKSINQLNNGGRCAYIIPSEFLNADYGVAVKKYLLESRKVCHIIVFDFKEEVFEDAITTACIVLCSNETGNHSLRFSLVENLSQLHDIEQYIYRQSYPAEHFCEYEYEMLAPTIKWHNYYTKDVKKQYRNLVSFHTFAKVTRGIATGANHYFTFNSTKVEQHQIPTSNLVPCICHCTDVPNAFFDNNTFDKLAQENKSVFLFDGQKNQEDANVQQYIQYGINTHVNEKYLTASRSPWYALEKRPAPPIWVTVFNRSGLRFVRNYSKATNLTTFHSVYVNANYQDFTDLLFAYLLTQTAHDIFDTNRREYGNGLGKFEPNDLNHSDVLDLTVITQEDQQKILAFLNRIKRGETQCIEDIDIIVRKYALGNDTTNAEKSIDFNEVLKSYPEDIIHNTDGNEDLQLNKHLLISLVKTDNFEFFLDGSAKIYYTGKKFPSTIALNKLYYFMPYLKGKGIRDLYIIKIARVGTKAEVYPQCGDNDFRLVFEIEFVKQLFPDYKQVHLDIWQTFTDSTLDKLLANTEHSTLPNRA